MRAHLSGCSGSLVAIERERTGGSSVERASERAYASERERASERANVRRIERLSERERPSNLTKQKQKTQTNNNQSNKKRPWRRTCVFVFSWHSEAIILPRTHLWAHITSPQLAPLLVCNRLHSVFMLYTMSVAETRDRTGDLQIFGLALSQLSYRGLMLFRLRYSKK